MALSPNNAELLSAYLDGELTVEEQARVEQWLADDPAARRLLDELGAVSRMVGQLPDERLGEDLSVAVLKQAEREILIGRAGSDGQAATPKQPRGDAKATRREKKPWWHRARRLFGARGLGWSVAAVAVALLIMLVAPEMVDRDVAQAPVEDAPESDAKPEDRAKRFKQPAVAFESTDSDAGPGNRREQLERLEAADEEVGWGADVDDKLEKAEEEAGSRRLGADGRTPADASDAPITDHAAADHAPAARRSSKSGLPASGLTLPGKGGYGDFDRPDRPAEPTAPAPTAPEPTAPGTPAPARGKVDGLAAQGDLRRPAEHDALDAEAPMAEQEQLSQQKPSQSFGKTAPAADPAPDAGQAIVDEIGEGGKKLGSELSRQMARDREWSHRYQTRSAGTEPPMIVRLDITPTAARAGIVRRVLDAVTLAANQPPMRGSSTEAAAQSAEAAPPEQAQQAGEDSLLGPTSDDPLATSDQSAPQGQASPADDADDTEDANRGGVEIIPLHTTPDRIAAALTQLRAMPEKVRAISVEPVPGRAAQQALTRFNESSETLAPRKDTERQQATARQQADAPLRQPSSITREALPETQPSEHREQHGASQRDRRQSEAKQRIAEPSPVLVIVRIVPE